MQPIETFPNKPGVYQMLDSAGAVIYVGKAKNLKKRVANYFRLALDTKTGALMEKVVDIKIIVTSNESAALLLENELIKKHQPHYNILFKDDKSFPYLFLSEHEFPRLSIKRGAKKDKGKYFGPYPNASAAYHVLYLAKKVFRMRSCGDSYFRNRSRPCIQYQIKRCSAPCVDYISKEDYAHAVNFIEQFLTGKNDAIIDEITILMEKAAIACDYEKAALYRDQIADLRKLLMAQDNAEHELKKHNRDANKYANCLKSFSDFLHLTIIPKRIECFDVSHTQGEFAVVSCVVFNEYGPEKNSYRRYNVKPEVGGDDYASLREGLLRRYRDKINLPQVIIIDGGKGQLGVAASVLCELQINDVVLLAIAKGPERRPGLEEIYLFGHEQVFVLDPSSPTLHFLQQIRDEAHRFAISAHRKKLARARVGSVLDDIEGVGPKKRTALLKYFGGLQEIESAGVDDLSKVEGISLSLAKRIYDYLHA